MSIITSRSGTHLIRLKDAVANPSDLEPGDIIGQVTARVARHELLFRPGIHKIADPGNIVGAANATNQGEANTLLNELKLDYNAHRIVVSGGVHISADTTNVVGAADATDLGTSITLANALKLEFNDHRALAGATVHYVTDQNNAITSPNASDLPSVLLLANELKTDYNAHRGSYIGLQRQISCHSGTNISMVFFLVDAGTTTPASRGNCPVLSYADGVTQYSTWMCMVDERYIDDGAASIKFIWWPDTTQSAGAKVCRWEVSFTSLVAGDIVPSSAEVTAAAIDEPVATLTPAFKVFQSVAVYAVGNTHLNQNHLIFCTISRLGGHANDTMEGAAQLAIPRLVCSS